MSTPDTDIVRILDALQQLSTAWAAATPNAREQLISELDELAELVRAARVHVLDERAGA